MVKRGKYGKTMNREIRTISQVLSTLSESEFYGELTVKMEKGRIVRTNCNQTLKIETMDSEPIILLKKKNPLDK